MRTSKFATLVLCCLLIPQITFAAWWNPMSLFRWFQSLKSEQVQTNEKNASDMGVKENSQVNTQEEKSPSRLHILKETPQALTTDSGESPILETKKTAIPVKTPSSGVTPVKATYKESLFPPSIGAFVLQSGSTERVEKCKPDYCVSTSKANYSASPVDTLTIEISTITKAFIEDKDKNSIATMYEKIKEFHEFPKGVLENCTTTEKLMCIASDKKTYIVVSHNKGFLVKKEYVEEATANMAQDVYKERQREYIRGNAVVAYFLKKLLIAGTASGVLSTPSTTAQPPAQTANTPQSSGAGSVVVFGDQIKQTSVLTNTKGVIMATYRVRAGDGEDVSVTKMNFHIRNVTNEGVASGPQGVALTNFRAKIKSIDYPITVSTNASTGRLDGVVQFLSKVVIPKGQTLDVTVYADVGDHYQSSGYGSSFDLYSHQNDFEFKGETSGQLIIPTSPNSKDRFNFYWSGYINVPSTSPKATPDTPYEPAAYNGTCEFGYHVCGNAFDKNERCVSNSERCPESH